MNKILMFHYHVLRKLQTEHSQRIIDIKTYIKDRFCAIAVFKFKKKVKVLSTLPYKQRIIVFKFQIQFAGKLF